MTLRWRSLLLASVAGAAGASASAAALGCGNVAGTGAVQMVGNSFPAMAHIARIAESCAKPGCGWCSS